MKQQRKVLALTAALIISLANIAAVAQQTLDRMKVPPPGPMPVLHVPTWTKTQLADGAMLIVSERHNLPLVSFNITFIGATGADTRVEEYDPSNGPLGAWVAKAPLPVSVGDVKLATSPNGKLYAISRNATQE